MTNGFSYGAFSLGTNGADQLVLNYFLPSVINWTATNGNWAASTNWSNSINPLSNSTVAINNGGTANITNAAGTIANLIIGTNTGSNALVITAPGGLNVTSNTVIGQGTNASNNSLTINGGSLTNGGNLIIGSNGSSNSMLISGGGSAVASNTIIGAGTNASNNTLTVNNGSLSNSGNLYVGSNGPNNTLVIGTNTNSIVTAANTYIGFGSNSTGNLLSVNGGTLSNTGSIQMGGTGGSGTLSLNNGGSVYATNIVIYTNSTLGGNGTVNAAPGGVSVMGGTIAPSGTNSLVINGDLNFNAPGSTYQWSLFNNTTNIVAGVNFTVPLVLNGNLSVTTGSLLDINLTNTVAATNSLWTTTDVTNSWVLMQGTNSSITNGLNFSLNFIGLTNGFSYGAFSLATNASSQLVLNYFLPSVINWTATNGSWTSATNWSNSINPLTNSSVAINNGGTANITNAAGTIANLIIGTNTGSNALVITAPGSLNVTSNTVVGQGTNASNNSLVINGGSLTNGGNLIIGSNGSSNSMLISGGGSAVASNTIIGAGTNASNNTLTVNNGSLSNSGNLYVGSNGPNNTLVIGTNTNSIVTAANTYIGFGSNSTGNLLSVNGGTLSNTGSIQMGGTGGSGTLSLNNGGTVDASSIVVNTNSTLGGNGTINASGSGVLVNGGTIAPNGTNALVINGDLNFSTAGSTYQWTLFNNTTNNAPGNTNFTMPLVLSGALSVSNGSVFSMLFTNTVAATNSFWNPGVTNSWLVMTNSLDMSAGTNFRVAFAAGSFTTGFSTNEFFLSVSTDGTGLFLNYYQPVLNCWNTNAGSWTNPASWSSGVVPSSNNIAVINNGGTATLTNSGLAALNLIIGTNTASNSLVISNGGSLAVTGDTVIGQGANASNNILTVNNGSLSNSGDLYVGSNGPNNTLVIGTNANSIVTAANTYIGFGSNSAGNLLSVNGGTLSNSGSIQMGGTGGSGTLSLNNGASVYATNIVIYTNSTLGGNGTVNATPGGVSVMGGTIAPNTYGGTNALVINGDLNFNAPGSTYLWSLFNNTTNLGSTYTNFTAPLVLNGNLSVSNGAVLQINLTNTVNATNVLWTTANITNTWVLMTNSASSSMAAGTNFSFSFLTVPGATNINQSNFFLDVVGNTLTLNYYLPAPIYWTGTTGTNWNTPSNWSNNTPPTSRNPVIVDNGTNGSSPVLTNAATISGLIVGNTNNSNTMTVAGGGSLTVNGPVTIGAGSNSASNTLTVNGGTLNASDNLYVGSNGPNNTLVIGTDSSSIVTAANTYIGFGSNSTGNLLSVNGGTLSNSGSIQMGGTGGNGTLSLNNGGSVYATNIVVNTNSTLGGNGTVNATNGGVTVNGGTIAPTGTNSLLINGNLNFNTTGSTYLWTLYNNTTTNTGNTNFTLPLVLNGSLSVAPGSLLDVAMTNLVASTNAFWLATDTNRTWVLMSNSAASSMAAATNFTLNFLGQTSGFSLGAFSLTTNGNTVVLNYLLPSTVNWTGAAGSNWNTSGSWSNSINPQSSTTVAIDNGTNGSSPVLTNPATIAGLIVGNTNSNNSMTVAGGGSLTVNGPVVVGLGSNSASNTLTVNGGTINSTGNLYVGSNGPNNTMVISNGASVTVASNTYIGFGTNSTGNLLSINGGSLSNGGTVNIGYGGSGTLSLANGGSVTASNIVVNTNSTLGGNGTVNATNGGVTVNGGIIAPTGTSSLVINGNLNFTSTNGGYLWTLYNNSTNASGVNYTAPLTLNGSLTVTSGTPFLMNFTNLVSGTDTFWTNNRTWTVMTGADLSSGTNYIPAFAPGSYTSGFVPDEFTITSSNNQLFLNYFAPVTFVATNTTNITVVVSTNNKVIQEGAGTTTLGGSNASSLWIIVNSGTINAATNTTALSPLVNVAVNNGVFGVTASGTNTVNSFTVNGGTVEAASNAIVNVTNSFVMNGGTLSGGSYQAANYIFTPSNTATVSAALGNLNTNSWALIAATNGISGTTVFNSAMTYTGGTLITNATLQIGSGSLTGSLVGLVTNNGTFQNGSSGSLSLINLATNITGTGIIGQAGTGTLTLSIAPLNGFSGSFAVSTNGTLQLTNNADLGGGTNVYLANSGTLQLAGSVTNFSTSIAVTNGTGIIQNAGSGSLTLSGDLTKLNRTLVLSGSNVAVTGRIIGRNGVFDSDLVVSNGTVLMVSAQTNYFGPTLINNASTLTIGTNNTLPTDTVVILGTGTDSGNNTFNLAGNNQSLAGLTSPSNSSSVNLVTNSGAGTVSLTLNDTANPTNTTYAGTIAGNIALVRSGTGAITLTQNNTYTGGTTISSGKIVTTANTALGTGTVALNGGTLEVRSLLTLGAITWSGGQIALPTLTSANGIYVVSTNGLTLSGGGTFNLTGASLTIGKATPLLGATNISSYSTNDFSVTGVGSYSLLIYSNTLWIDLLANPDPAYPNFVIPGLTDNQTRVAQALNVWAGDNPTGDKATVLNAVTNIPTSQWAAAFDQMSPRFYQQMATISFNLANAQYNELVQRLYGLRVAGTGFSMTGFADNTMVLEGQGDGEKNPKNDILRPGLDSHWGMFLDGNGIFAKANSGNMLPGYNFESGGITTGLTYKWNESFGSGIYAGYQGAYSKNNGLGTLIDNAVKFGLFGAYGTPDGKGLYADGLIGGGYNNYQVSRTIQFGSINRTANSTPGAGELDSMLAAGYNWRKGNWSFGPVGSLQYTYFGVNSFNETGAQSLNQNNQGWNASSMVSSLGANCAYSWQAKKDIMVVPQINLGWQHEFLQNPYAINTTMGGTPYSNWSAVPNRDTLYTGVGVTLEYKKTWNTAFFYNAAAGNQNITSQNIFWSAGLKF